jgi:hypothetical protein
MISNWYQHCQHDNLCPLCPAPHLWVRISLGKRGEGRFYEYYVFSIMDSLVSYLGTFSKENVAVVLLLSLETYEGNSLWKNQIKLLEDSEKKSPN